MIDWGIDPNEQVYSYKRGSFRTPLQQACWLRSIELVRVLIDGGAKVNLSARKTEAGSALMNALYSSDRKGNPMRYADPELVRILLHAGAIVNPGFGESPLAEAAKSGHVEAVDLLVSAGADVHFTDDFGSTPLANAVDLERNIPDRDVISVARILLQAGAYLHAKFTDGSGEFVIVLQSAIYRNNMELI